MQKPDLIIRNGMVLTMDARNTIFEKGEVHTKGDTLVHVGRENVTGAEGKKVIDARGGLVLPGLINGHTHAAMTLFRGLADDLPLMEWLNNYIFPVERRIDGEFVYDGTMLACVEMIMSGTTTFCDMYLFEDRVAEAARDAGMRCLVGEVLYDFPSPNYGPLENGFNYTQFLIDKWRHDPLVHVAVEPHAVFTCSPELLVRADGIARDNKVRLIMHVAETKSEMAQIREKFKRKPFEHLERLGVLGPHVTADHCVHLEESEMARIERHGVSVVNNPESNMKLASGVSPVPELLERNISVGLGTDGCASNNNLDLVAEMDTAAKVHKLKTMDPTALDALTALKMATIMGARALGLDGETGSLETGKRADVIVLDVNSPHLVPMYNPYSHLVYAARGSDVIHSIINGRHVMDERNLTCLDLQEVMSRAMEKSERVKRWIK